MSVGFGFSLPALAQYGGGGNNPFGQLGPTLDLSFAGTVTDTNDPNGYTLNTNFITPEYQVAAQYAIWETGTGLTQKTFSQIVTFSRTSGATWFNAAGNLVGVDFSTTSVTIGTGSKTFTLDATAGVNRSWAVGDSVLISQQSNSANNMTGTVTSYTASTQVLVVNVTSTGGSGTIASWRVSSLIPRFDYNPSTLAARGLLIEESRTNSIRNNTMVGAAAGTPGTLPTNWSGGATISGLARTIVGIGTENGISYIDVNYAGTTTAVLSNSSIISTEPSNQITAASGQTWTHSVYLKLQSGSFPASTTVNVRISETDGTSVLANSNTPTVPTSAALNTQRYAITRTLTNALTTFVQPVISLTAPISTAIDFTLRIGLPQLEQGAFATSVIPTTVAAVTRAADVASVNTLSPWFNAAEGTLFAEGLLEVAPNLAGNQLVAISDGTNNNRIQLGASTTVSGNLNFAVTTSGTLQANPVIGSVSSVGPHKVAGAYATNSFQISLNGALGTEDVSGTVPTILSVLNIGTAGNPVNKGNLWLRRITYWPRRLANADLQAITV